MTTKKLPDWFAKLKLDKELDAYKCKAKLGGSSIDVLLFMEDGKLSSRQNLAIAAGELLSKWSEGIDKVVSEIRRQLKKEKRLTAKDEISVSVKTIEPFSLSLFQNDGDEYYSFGIHLKDVLADDEYIDFSRDLAHTWTSVDIACTE
jgi:hypothetical protein